jgi:hypothetical protein
MLRFALLAIALLFATQGMLVSQTIRPINETAPTAFGVFWPTYPATMGYAFSTQESSVLVLELGCTCPDAQAHVVRLWDSTSTSTPIGMVTTNAASAGVWRWGTLATPVMLVPNREYRVSVDIIGASGQGRYEMVAASAPAAFRPSGTINYINAPYITNATTYPTVTTNSYLFGLADIGYVLGLQVNAVPGTAPLVAPNDQGPGGNGEVAGVFTIQNMGAPNVELYSIELTASGSGDDSADFSEVAVYWDSNDNGTFDFGTDTLVDSHAAFPVDDGSLTFDVPTADQPFAANTTRTYFIVVKLRGPACPRPRSTSPSATST